MSHDSDMTWITLFGLRLFYYYFIHAPPYQKQSHCMLGLDLLPVDSNKRFLCKVSTCQIIHLKSVFCKEHINYYNNRWEIADTERVLR